MLLNPHLHKVDAVSDDERVSLPCLLADRLSPIFIEGGPEALRIPQVRGGDGHRDRCIKVNCFPLMLILRWKRNLKFTLALKRLARRAQVSAGIIIGL